jgi:arylsulfatase A-like enzyme
MITVAGMVASDFLTADGYVASDGDRVRMPNVARLAREGVVGERALPPSPGSSYASHATLVTGLLPSRHGVVADTKIDLQGTSVTPFWESKQLVATALWDAAIGRGVMALGWPTTVGARIELILPEARPSEGGEPWLDFMRQISSPFLTNQLQVIADDALSTAKTGLTTRREPSSWPTPSEKDAAIAEIACYVALSDRDPGLWLIRLDQTENEMRVAGSGSADVAAALGRIDDEIGALVDCLEESEQLANSAIFVVGDVAYAPVHTRVDPNVALVARGLIGRDPRSAIGVRSWLAVTRSQGRSAYVYAKDAGNAVAARKVLEAEAARTGAFRVVPAAELAQTDVDPQAWFGLAAAPGFEIGDGLSKPTLRPAETRSSAGALRGTADLTNSVGFVAWGRGIRRRVRLSQIDFVDIAPTISKLFGLRLDESIDGKPISGILRAATPPPPPGPKRLGIGADGDIDRTLRDMGGRR